MRKKIVELKDSIVEESVHEKFYGQNDFRDWLDDRLTKFAKEIELEIKSWTPSKSGKKGGNKNKEKGSAYFSKISKMKQKHVTCILKNCNNKHYAKKLCSKHYTQERRKNKK